MSAIVCVEFFVTQPENGQLWMASVGFERLPELFTRGMRIPLPNQIAVVLRVEQAYYNCLNETGADWTVTTGVEFHGGSQLTPTEVAKALIKAGFAPEGSDRAEYYTRKTAGHQRYPFGASAVADEDIDVQIWVPS